MPGNETLRVRFWKGNLKYQNRRLEFTADGRRGLRLVGPVHNLLVFLVQHVKFYPRARYEIPRVVLSPEKGKLDTNVSG